MSSHQRPLEPGIVSDFKVNLSYGKYLDLDRILSAFMVVEVVIDVRREEHLCQHCQYTPSKNQHAHFSN